MLLALVLGKAQGKNLSENIKKNKTNVEIDSFENISEYCNTAIIRHKVYDRVLILGAKCTSNELNTLYDYWYTKTPRETDIIVLGKLNADEPKCKEFLTIFNTPKAATLLVDTVTLSILMQAVSDSVTQIQSKYGFQIERETELDGGIDLGFGKIEEPKEEEFTPVPMPVEQKPTNTPKKKRSLLGAIFGTNKDENTNENPTQNTNLQSTQSNNISNTNEFQQSAGMMGFDQIPNNMIGFEQMQNVPSGFEQMPNVPNGFEQIPNVPSGFEQMPNVPNGFEQIPNVPNGFEQMPNVPSGFEQIPNVPSGFEQIPSVPSGFEQMQNVPNGFEQISNVPSGLNTKNNLSDNAQDVFSEIDDLTFDGFMKPEKDNIPLEQKSPLDQIDELEFSGFTTAAVPTQEQPQQSLDTAIDLNGINTAQAETQYRQKIEQPKIITKTVVKPVLGGDGGLSVINNIKQGKLHKVLIVSGDRGSGVTSASLAIARHFAKSTPVLYFDCDIKNHGILNYLDYVRLQDFEELQLAGTHACKTNREFPHCIIPYDDNLDLLISDFSVEVSEGDLQCSQRVIASQYTNYSITVVDCPIQHLHLLQDLFLIGDAIFCVEVSARGIMNYLCQSSDAGLDDRYARTLVSKGTIFETKLNSKVNDDSLFSYYKSIYTPDVGETNWLDMERYKFNGKIDERVLNKVLER